MNCGDARSQHGRDTTTWYERMASHETVSASVYEFVATRSGRTILDLGCGNGGYAAQLALSGRTAVAADTNPRYAALAARLGVSAVAVDATPALPFADGTFRTVLLLEVLEHLVEPRRLLKEALRVSSHNLLVTVPDCTHLGALSSFGLTFEHMLETDHRNFFTQESLAALLDFANTSVTIEPGDYVDLGMARLHGGIILAKPLAVLRRLGLYRPRLSSRLFAEIQRRRS